jgi:nickel/cobalt transporter (NiCoT) family protein
VSLSIWRVKGNLPALVAWPGAGVLAYVLGMRYAFDADHIAVIDDTIRGQ